jgi:hypothetical protein
MVAGVSRIQINREIVTCPFEPEAQFRELRLIYWMPGPQSMFGRILFVALTPLYVVVCLVFAFIQMLLDFVLSAHTWIRVVRGDG